MEGRAGHSALAPSEHPSPFGSCGMGSWVKLLGCVWVSSWGCWQPGLVLGSALALLQRCRGRRAPLRSVFLRSQHLELPARTASVCSFTCLNKQTICLLPLHPLFLCSSTAQCFSEGSGSCSLRGPYLLQVAPSCTVQCSLQFQTKYLLQFLKLVLVLFKQLPNLMSSESLLCLS